MRILFIGDVTGERALAELERHLPELQKSHGVDFTVVNAENLSVTGQSGATGFGMLAKDLERLLALNVEVVTGGNHSWDGPDATEVLGKPNVLRPLNVSPLAPGRGSLLVETDSGVVGIINVAGRSALPTADSPYDAIQRQLEEWQGKVKTILVDLHSGSVEEKTTLGFALDGQVSAVLGTHTHVQTLDTLVLPGGTAYVTDVGMTGPLGGVQGLAPASLVETLKTRLPNVTPLSLAEGPIQLGAVLIDLDGGRATGIQRLGMDLIVSC